ncbi:MAG: phytanoyl-CoA dioxygenase family protein [Planctomycetota bacterium]|jgi:ectoine hydroxylase-related dioxygenase (phytanoyl-CoA dioxygenase family)|nr:phytanoyl-CoA dioxygenase family protein [Planctomycetota bacterium]
MLSQDQIDHYHERGYLAVEDVYSEDEVQSLRRVTDEFIQKSAEVTDHTDAFDLEPGHSPESPKLRRLKGPISLHEVYARAIRQEQMLDIVSQLIGSGIRTNGNKLNIKYSHFGSAVEWHQDWGFYPHTNDDLLAVGVAIDDMNLENGCMMVIPGSHKGPIFDHHQGGRFVGGITDPGFSPEGAVPVQVKAGGISLHHVRIVHGSEPNKSANPRRLMLFQLAAADAWPLSGAGEWEAFNRSLLCGEPTNVPRVEPVPVRMPLPPAELGGSIYEIQTLMNERPLATM